MARSKKGDAASSLPLFPDRIDLDELQRLLDEARKLVNYQVTDFSAELLSGKFKEESEAEGDIFIPHYQRKLVWTDQRQSYFIESLLLRVPVPPLFLYDVNGRLEIIDGSQRMRTINRFMRDDLRLADLEKLDFVNGFVFSELPAATQLRFKNTPIRTFVLTEDTDGTTRFETWTYHLPRPQANGPKGYWKAFNLLNRKSCRNLHGCGYAKDRIQDGPRGDKKCHLREK